MLNNNNGSSFKEVSSVERKLFERFALELVVDCVDESDDFSGLSVEADEDFDGESLGAFVDIFVGLAVVELFVYCSDLFNELFAEVGIVWFSLSLDGVGDMCWPEALIRS